MPMPYYFCLFCVLSASTTSIFTPASCMPVLTCLGHHDWSLGLLEQPPHSAEQEVSTDHPWSVGLSSLLRCLVCASCMADAATRRVQHQLLPACYFPVGSALPPAGPICVHITRPSPGNRRKPDTGKISTSPLLILSFFQHYTHSLRFPQMFKYISPLVIYLKFA